MAETIQPLLNYEPIGSEATLFESGDGLDFKKANPNLASVEQGHALGQAALTEQSTSRVEKAPDQLKCERIGDYGKLIDYIRKYELGS